MSDLLGRAGESATAACASPALARAAEAMRARLGGQVPDPDGFSGLISKASAQRLLGQDERTGWHHEADLNEMPFVLSSFRPEREEARVPLAERVEAVLFKQNYTRIEVDGFPVYDCLRGFLSEVPRELQPALHLGHQHALMEAHPRLMGTMGWPRVGAEIIPTDADRRREAQAELEARILEDLNGP